ncbi:endoplasmic reticulum resident protein 27 [Perognathus longimembris pacificus]|uniref:endoplasmic reticulum resident protein 27 n=1 Tax=Perognathus longimembris pacificus TaxID=214514 RepID=UPI00201952B6|nr:endoplasmic reticulum resident protein 27 [Perognathus longimembris pacificus]
MWTPPPPPPPHLRPAPGVATDTEDSTEDPGAVWGPVWLTDVQAAVDFVAAAEVTLIGFFQDLEMPAVATFRGLAPDFQDVPFGMANDSEVLRHYNITGNAISLFRLVDNQQLNLEDQALAGLEPATLSRFIRTNNLRLVTEYNAMTVLGLFNTMIEIHLLLLMDKASPGFQENLATYQTAAKLYQGEILFVLVDSGQKDNGKVVSYFRLRESQLPALAIYRTLDDQWDTLPISRVDVEQVKEFCGGFLAGKLLREDGKSEDTSPKEEL